MTENFAEIINQSALDGWASYMGVRLLVATGKEVTAEIVIEPKHLQPYGVVHGGVYAGVIETLASIGAALHVMPRGHSVVGLENRTSFLRAVRSGTLRAICKPLHPGRRTQVWEGQIVDEQGRLVASGSVRLMVLEAGAGLAGETVGIKNQTQLPKFVPGSADALPQAEEE